MPDLATHQKPKFFWQGVCILLPVAVLAVVSLISLHEDERHAEADARNRAAESVQSLARAIHSSANDELQRYLRLQDAWMMGLPDASSPSVTMNGEFPDAKLKVDLQEWERDYPGLRLEDLAVPEGWVLADGREIQPPDFPPAPVPAKWFLQLSPEQRRLWETLRRLAKNGPTATPEFYRCQKAFLDSNPSPNARGAEFYLQSPPKNIAANSGALATETGISFEEIACYQLLTATNVTLTPELLQSVWWQVIDHTSFISPRLIQLAEGLTNRANSVLQQKVYWTHRYWDAQSKSHEWLASCRELPGLTDNLNPLTARARWTSGAHGSALAFFQVPASFQCGEDADGVPLAGPGGKISLVPQEVIEAIFRRALAENSFLIPSYTHLSLTVEGKDMRFLRDNSLANEKSPLGSATQQFGTTLITSAADFSLDLFLTSREQMLAAENHRAHLFIALILGTVFTALAGLFVARRAFYRQLQLNEMKSNFVSSVSHELRAPIASVRLMAENLAGGKIPDAPRQHEYFRFIVQECRRLSSLIENVLDFSRIEQGRKQYEFEPTDLMALTRTTVNLMEPYAMEKGVNLRLEPVGGPSAVESMGMEADGRALQQALVNLIDNAVKHSPQGETVMVEIQVQKNGGVAGANAQPSVISLSVTDHGQGIPLDEQGKIFERFYRLGSELRRETQGVGIGLSVVKHIVDAHHGRVLVQSKPGHGSRFTIELPIKR
jgi:signal transduction histidine kinase